MGRSIRHRLVGSIGVVVALGAGSPAAGQSDGTVPAGSVADEARLQRARALFLRAAELAEQDRWGDALDGFLASAALRPHASTTYNIGYCQRGLGQYTRARRSFASALVQNRDAGGGQLTADQQNAAAEYLDEVDAKLARLAVTVDSLDLRLQVDGRPLEVESARGAPVVAVAGTRDAGPGEVVPSERFTLLIDPGAHVFGLWRGAVHEERVVRLEPGQRRELTFAQAQPDEPWQAGSRSVRMGWAVGMAGVSLTALVFGSVFGGMAIDRWSDAQDACPKTDSCPSDDGSERSLEARQYGDLATASFVVAGGALAGAVVLWLTAPADQAQPQRDVAWVPMGGPGWVGVGLRGTVP